MSGPSNYKGIFVEHVNPGSMGAEVGIEAGDQIVNVNGTSFLNITHQEVVDLHLGFNRMFNNV